MGTMSKEEILKILEDAKDKNSDVPMRLVRQAFEKLPEPCEDAVSRQAAIDALCDNCDNVQAVCPHYPCKQYTAIDALSPAQPEIANQTEESAQNVPNGELISKKAAIEALEKMSANYGKIGRREWHPHIEECKAELSMLPSAQPEIILCKDCDWWTKQEDSLQGRCARYGMYPTGYWYCAGARERREE